MSVAARNHLGRTADRLERDAAALVQTTLGKILAGAQARTRDRSHDLDESMRIEDDGRFAGSVAVGRRAGDGFYAHMVENGTVHSEPRPFLTPAAEAQRGPFRRGLRDIFR